MNRTNPMSTMRPARGRISALALCLLVALVGAAGCDDPTRSDPVAGVEVTATATRVAVGQSIQLSASVLNGTGAVMTGRAVAWTSSNEAVAAVAADGRVTGQAVGTATITATAGGKQDRVEVAVDPAVPPVARVTMEPDSFLLVVGNTVAIRMPTEDQVATNAARVLAVPRGASGAVLLWLPASYSTSNAAVATVSDSGVVRAVAPGTATITARIGAVEGRLAVTVERPYTTTYLGTLSGLPESRATGINELGQVVGYSAASAPLAVSEPVLSRGWTWQDGRLTELGVPDSLGSASTRTVVPWAINARGQVGGEVRSERGTFITRWENERATALVPSPGPNLRFGGMNDLGEMVGGWTADRCTRNCDGGGWIVRAGTLSPISNYGALRIMPRAINGAGQITGTLYQAGSGTESGRAFFLESAAAAAPVFPSTNPILSEGNAIDAQGRVYGHDLVGGEIRPFTWRPGGAVTHLGMLWRGLIASANAANDRGDAVGRNTCISCPGTPPVLFRGGSRAVRVEDLVVASDWVWETVTDINDRGQVVGYGTHRTTGARGALLLTPPAP